MQHVQARFEPTRLGKRVLTQHPLVFRFRDHMNHASVAVSKGISYIVIVPISHISAIYMTVSLIIDGI